METTIDATIDQAAAIARGNGNGRPEDVGAALAGRRIAAAADAGDRPAPPRPPHDDAFGEDHFAEAPDLAALAAWLIARYPDELGHLENAEIAYAWKRKGGKRKGFAVDGRCAALTGYARFAAGADFLLWIAADRLRERVWSARETDALLFGQLCYVEQTVNEDEKSPRYGETQLRIRDEEFKGFRDEVRIFGAWRTDLALATEAFTQAPLGV